MKSSATREGADGKLRNSIARTTRKGGFDGFLNTFLGKDKAGKSGTSKTGASGVGSGMKTADRQALKRSLDKTVPAEESDQAWEDSETERLAAAEEAAMLIWNILYGSGLASGTGQGSNTLYGSLSQLAGLLCGRGSAASGALSGLDGGVGLDAMQNAIETANASAEMNSAAVLDALDELLDGMPRGALRDALSRTAGELGFANSGDMDMFAAITEALNAEVLSVNAASGSDLLLQLASLVRPNTQSLTAENAGLPFTSQDILQLFQQFIEENGDGGDSESPITRLLAADAEAVAGLADSFAAWLNDNGNASIAKELPRSSNKLIEMLVAGAGLGGEGGSAVGSDKKITLAQNLEKVLQSFATRAADNRGEAMSDENAAASSQSVPGQGAETAATASGGLGAGVNSVPAGQAPMHQAAPQNAQLSSMLVQIENIERVAEAMRMATRNGVNNITMQLSPAELGKVLLRVEARGGVVSAFLKVEKPEAAAQLTSSLGQLRETLKGMGFELGELDIQHRPPSGTLADLDGGRRGDERNGEPSGFGPATRLGTGEAEADDTTALAAETGINGPGGLNLFA